MTKQQQNSEYRNYSEVIATTKHKMDKGGYKKCSKKNKALGVSRQQVKEYLQAKADREYIL